MLDEIFEMLFDNATNTIDAMFQLFPTYSFPAVKTLVTAPVETGLSWLAYFVPVNILVGITMAWLLAVVALTVYNAVFKWAGFIRG